MKWVVCGVGGFSIGAIFTAIGWDLTTPQFWFAAIPLSFMWGVAAGKIFEDKI